jgi:hypothetical protein
MILRRNQDLFNTVKALAGVNDFTDNEITDLVSFTNRRLTMAYNTSQTWPRYIVVSEKRKLSSLTLSNITSTNSTDIALLGSYYLFGEQIQRGAPDYVEVGGIKSNIYAQIGSPVDTFGIPTRAIFRIYNSGTTWQWVIGNPGLNLQSDGSYYLNSSNQRLIDNAVSTTVGEPWDVVAWDETNSTEETAQVVESNHIPYQESPKQQIGEFIRIHKNRSFLNNSSTEYDFYVDINGANVLNNSSNDSELFVTYKKPIVDTTTGQIITSLDTTATSNYLTEIPLEFFNYTAHGVYADFLRMDGQHDKAAFEEQKADMFLATELERIDIINNNNSLNHKFSTYVNRSTR